MPFTIALITFLYCTPFRNLIPQNFRKLYKHYNFKRLSVVPVIAQFGRKIAFSKSSIKHFVYIYNIISTLKSYK